MLFLGTGLGTTLGTVDNVVTTAKALLRMAKAG
jgi:hypothetical protein